MIRQRFVIDTSALTDSQTREIEGGTLCVAMGGILDIIAEARLHLGISCYIPFPSVYNELRDFSKNNGCDEEILAKIDTWLVKKTPDRYEVKIPSKIFYDYVDFMRGRINKGMDVAEEAIWEGATECLFRTTKAKTKHEIEPEIERNVIGEIITRFRDKLSTSKYTVTGLRQNAAYCFRVSALDNHQQGPWSNAVTKRL